MKDALQRSYGRVHLGDADKGKILESILKQSELQKRKVKILGIAGIAALFAAAIAAVFFIHVPDTVQPVATAIAASASCSSEVQTPTGAPLIAGSVVLSINPSVEFKLGEDGFVTEIVGLNEDGATLIEGIDFTGLSLENATIIVVNQLILQGYITAAGIQEEINISLSSDTITLDTLSVMTDIIQTAAAQQNIAVDVIQNTEANSLQIVLVGQGEPDVWPELVPEAEAEDAEIGLELEFLLQEGTYSAYVDNVLIHTSEGETINNLQDFAGTELNQAALRSIIELLDKGYITDSQDSQTVRFFFTGDCAASDIEGVASLTELLMAEYDMQIAVTTDTSKKEMLLTCDASALREAQESKFAMRDVLNYMVNKDEADLSPRQITILKMAFNFREYQSLMEKRYFVVVPDLVGMTEEKAIEMLQQVGLVPVVVREKVPGYDPEQENGGLAVPGKDEKTSSEIIPQPDEGQNQPREWEFPVVDFGCVFYQDMTPGCTYQSGLQVQINVIVPVDDTRPEVADYRDDSGIVIREMDVPFNIAGYPDTFSLSGANGFDAMIDEMNAAYTIENAADYTVTIDRNTGWDNTAIISIAHKDGFPMSRFFVQDGRIIEHEFLWRRDAPAAPDKG